MTDDTERQRAEYVRVEAPVGGADMCGLTVGSLFSGIGGTDLAFERAGMKVIWNCEIDAHCRTVLGHHWPGVPRFKDVNTVHGESLRRAGLAPDILVGGFPCQDVSVAGARAGLAGERSGLFFEFARILEETRPAWCLIENVPGLLSSHKGADMGTVIGHLVDIGYGVAWRVLDAQYFGVAQRRRRVFIVGCLGDRARAASVLFEPEGSGGDPPTRPAQEQEVAGTLGGDSGSRGWCDDTDRTTFIPLGFDKYNQVLTGDVTHTINAGDRVHNNADTPHVLLPLAFHMTQDPINGDVAPAIGGVKPKTGYSTIGVAYRKATKMHHPESYDGDDAEQWEETDRSDTLTERDGTAPATVVAAPLAVRRLTPLECLRLQGFPDTWLDLKLADSTKYRMVGNAVAVPVVEWIGRRIQAAHHAQDPGHGKAQHNDGQDGADR